MLKNATRLAFALAVTEENNAATITSTVSDVDIFVLKSGPWSVAASTNATYTTTNANG